MKIAKALLGAAVLVLPFGAARGDILVSLEARDAGGAVVTGSVAQGTALTVEVLLAVDEEHDPLPDVRAIEFDFGGSAAGLALSDFSWLLNTSAYPVQLTSLPRPGVATTRFNSSPDLLTLDGEPVAVASFTATANATGLLDVGFSAAVAGSSSAAISADFSNPIEFTAAAGNVSGGTFEVTVDGSSDDSDGDGVPDDEDAFPDDPDESTDTDGNGVGDNADPDDDGDGVDDPDDTFPQDPDETADTDSDGTGDNADAFPTDPDEQVDTDDNGVGDNADPDDDGDGVDDADDAFPQDPTETTDSDGDGIGDNAEDDQNMTPRVGGGLCGLGAVGALWGALGGWAALWLQRSGPRRRWRSSAGPV